MVMVVDLCLIMLTEKRLINGRKENVPGSLGGRSHEKRIPNFEAGKIEVKTLA